jgi:hypothetical protein
MLARTIAAGEFELAGRKKLEDVEDEEGLAEGEAEKADGEKRGEAKAWRVDGCVVHA